MCFGLLHCLDGEIGPICIAAVSDEKERMLFALMNLAILSGGIGWCGVSYICRPFLLSETYKMTYHLSIERPHSSNGPHSSS